MKERRTVVCATFASSPTRAGRDQRSADRHKRSRTSRQSIPCLAMTQNNTVRLCWSTFFPDKRGFAKRTSGRQTLPASSNQQQPAGQGDAVMRLGACLPYVQSIGARVRERMSWRRIWPSLAAPARVCLCCSLEDSTPPCMLDRAWGLLHAKNRAAISVPFGGFCPIAVACPPACSG